MKNTTFYSLKQPEDNDNVLIDDLNGNFDVIDQTLHELDEEKAAKAKPKSAGNLAELTADGALQDSGRAPGKPNGVATLDGNGKIPVSQVPNKYLPLAGGTMSGPINMGNQRITNLPKPAADTEPLRRLDGLSSLTAALFGLGADSVPDEAFAYLGKYAQHWWKKRPIKYKAVITGTLQDVYMVNNGRQSDTGTVEFSNSIIASESDSQVVELVRPGSIELSYSNYQVANDEIKGKYFRGYINFRNPGIIESGWTNVYYYPGSEDDVTRGGDAFKGYWVQCRAYATKTYKDYGDAVYVSSSSRNEYPDSGESGGYEYEYLGVPFENAVTAPKIATGSYVGTGTYGADNPNSLTFDGIPKMVCVFDSTGSGFTENGGGFIWIQGNVGSISYNDNKFTQIGNTLSWYTDTAQNQLNNSGKTYVYLALI